MYQATHANVIPACTAAVRGIHTPISSQTCSAFPKLNTTAIESSSQPVVKRTLATVVWLQGSHLSTMPDGRALPAANYRDAVKPLRRSLKAMGQGSLTAGRATAPS